MEKRPAASSSLLVQTRRERTILAVVDACYAWRRSGLAPSSVSALVRPAMRRQQKRSAGEHSRCQRRLRLGYSRFHDGRPSPSQNREWMICGSGSARTINEDPEGTANRKARWSGLRRSASTIALRLFRIEATLQFGKPDDLQRRPWLRPFFIRKCPTWTGCARSAIRSTCCSARIGRHISWVQTGSALSSQLLL